MKKVFTLIILFTTLKLSAAVPHFWPDTMKSLAADSGKTKIRSTQKDSLKQTPPIVRKDSTTNPADVNYADSVKQTVLVLKKDSVFVSMLTHSDSLKQILPVLKADSSAVLVATVRQDVPKEAIIAVQKDVVSDPSPPEPEDNLPPVTSLIQLDSLKMTVIAEQVRQANLRKLILRNEQIKLAEVLKINNLDSLKQQLKVPASDTVKALIYTRIALKYLDYDTIGNGKKQLFYQNQAIYYTLQAIHEYSVYSDSTGLRLSFDHLARAYHSQKKYSQAKWFILQSNTLSRAKNDTPNIITSLVTLAAIKSDIKDYDLAMRDLDEALQLSETTHAPKTETEVLKNYALLYNRLQNYPKEAMVLKKRDSILDSIHKTDEALIAKAERLKKADSVQAKKKIYSSNIRKLYKNSSSRKIASL